jgi:hypothetical protein
MPNIKEVYARLKPALNQSKLTIRSQSTTDIINQVLSQHSDNAIEAKKIAQMFEGGDLHSTCSIIWDFLKYQVPYKVEPSDKQTTKTISRICYDALHGGGSDCKHYAGFTAAILDALGYKNWCYRFAGYSDYINVPTHVYCVANDNNGKIYIDAVINGFDLEKPFKFKIDKKIDSMSLYKLSGFDDNENAVGSWLSDKLNDAGKAVKQAADWAGDKARDAAKAAKEAADKVVQGVKTIGLAIPRNAFILLLRFNVHGWATGLKDKDWNQLAWWVNDFGGNRTDLQNAIKDGSKNKRILGFNDNDIIYPTMIGGIGEPVTIATSLASAAPIIIKVSKLLDDAQKVADKVEGIKTKVSSVVDTAKKASAGFEAITGKKITDVIFKKETGQQGNKNGLTSSDVMATSTEDANKIVNAMVNNSAVKSTTGGGGLDPKILMIAGGAAVALLLILKKK